MNCCGDNKLCKHISTVSLIFHDFETIWVEIKNKKSQNLLCCCSYRHPNTEIEKLKGQLQRFYKLMSYERAFKMLKNDMCITEIGQAVLEL